MSLSNTPVIKGMENKTMSKYIIFIKHAKVGKSHKSIFMITPDTVEICLGRCGSRNGKEMVCPQEKE